MVHKEVINNNVPITAQQLQLEQAVALALEVVAHKSDAAEVTVAKTTGIQVTTRLASLEKVEFNCDGALEITLYCDKRQGSATTTDLRPEAIRQTVQAALEMARYTSADPCAGLADRDVMAFDAPALDLYYPWSLDPEAAAELAAACEQSALAVDPRIKNSEGATVSSHNTIKVYGNSQGLLQSYLGSYHTLNCCVIAEQEGAMQRDYAYSVARDPADLHSVAWVGHEAARRSIARLGARQLATQQAPVLFAAEVASSLFSHLAKAITGYYLYRHSSFLRDHLGCAVLPDQLSIVEQPHLHKGLASAPFDAEGVRTQNREIISAGVLQTYLLSSYDARKMGLQTTGHAGGIYNWHLVAPVVPFKGLLQQMQRGLIVTELLGQGVNIVTGDYSRGVAGFWVEAGEIQYPVHEVTIAGTLQEMFRHIVAVGDDTETRGAIQTGSLLIESMQIAGY